MGHFGDASDEDDNFVHIYKPAGHTFTFDDFDNLGNNNFSSDPTLWICLSVGMFFIVIFTCCFLFYVFSKKYSTPRHPAILHPPPTASTRDSNFRSPNSAQGIMHSSINRAFEQDRPDSDMPPDYTAVVLPSPPPDNGSNVNRPRYPRVAKAKKAETPPPAYLTVAPFQ